MSRRTTTQSSSPASGPDVTAAVRVRLPSRLDSPGAARHAIQALQGAVMHDQLAKARLIVTELVANSVKHTNGDSVDLEVAATRARLRGEVTDATNGFTPPEPDPDPMKTVGWGLILVKRLADRWGISKETGGVWFEIDLAA